MNPYSLNIIYSLFNFQYLQLSTLSIYDFGVLYYIRNSKSIKSIYNKNIGWKYFLNKGLTNLTNLILNHENLFYFQWLWFDLFLPKVFLRLSGEFANFLGDGEGHPVQEKGCFKFCYQIIELQAKENVYVGFADTLC